MLQMCILYLNIVLNIRYVILFIWYLSHTKENKHNHTYQFYLLIITYTNLIKINFLF